jgi:GH24 family phage-related lysozyme (muramidase)
MQNPHRATKKAPTVDTPDLSDYYNGMSLFNSYAKKVEIVQHRLTDLGYKIPNAERGLTPDGKHKGQCKFGFGTIKAIKDFQMKHGIYNDGALNGKTLMELFTYNRFFPFASDNQDHFTWEWAGQPCDAGFGPFGLPVSQDAHKLCCWAYDIEVRQPPRFPAESLHVSKEGKDAMFLHEAGDGNGITKNFHWPGGASGVTIGPGFDMGYQSAADIRKYLGPDGINVHSAEPKMNDADVINFLCGQYKGKEKEGPIGLRGNDANAWVTKYGINSPNQPAKLIKNIDVTAQKTLMKLYLNKYEQQVENDMRCELLTQYEYDALVSFVMNSAGKYGEVVKLLKSHHTDEAMQKWLGAGATNSQTGLSITKRRSDEVELFIRGDYWK